MIINLKQDNKVSEASVNGTESLFATAETPNSCYLLYTDTPTDKVRHSPIIYKAIQQKIGAKQVFLLSRNKQGSSKKKTMNNKLLSSEKNYSAWVEGIKIDQGSILQRVRTRLISS